MPTEIFEQQSETKIESHEDYKSGNKKGTSTSSQKTLNVTHSARLHMSRLSDSDSGGDEDTPKVKNNKSNKIPQLIRAGTAPSVTSPSAKRDIDWV